jgi:glyoxylase I family protein
MRYNPRMITGIEHTAIASPDPRRLAQWYVEHLDFSVNFEPPGSNTVFIKATDGSRIEIIEAKGAPRPQAMRDPGLRHLALTVTDFAASYDKLRAKHVAFLTEPETVGGNTLVFFTDCDGNILHLLHRQTPLP